MFISQKKRKIISTTAFYFKEFEEFLHGRVIYAVTVAVCHVLSYEKQVPYRPGQTVFIFWSSVKYIVFLQNEEDKDSLCVLGEYLSVASR